MFPTRRGIQNIRIPKPGHLGIDNDCMAARQVHRAWRAALYKDSAFCFRRTMLAAMTMSRRS
jgi:hypothetical protein